MKIGFAGAGYIINIHAKAAKNNGLELAAVAEKFADKAEPFARKFHIKRQYETM